tara:strand:+ start:329 stop:595 length:267 start_codon:yes stop_codon:yes gene_type:complete
MPQDKRKKEAREIGAITLHIASLPYLKEPLPRCSHYLDEEYMNDIIEDTIRDEWKSYSTNRVRIMILDYAYNIRKELEDNLLHYYITE